MLRSSISKHPGYATEKDEQIVALAKQKTFVTVRDITNKLRKTGITVNERTTLQLRLSGASDKYNGSLAKPLSLPKCIEKMDSR